MSETKSPDIIDRVKKIAADTQNIIDNLQEKVANADVLTATELQRISGLVRESQNVLSEASVRAKARRREQITKLEQMIANFDAALGTPGLDADTRATIKNLRRRRRAELIRLQTKEALDFGGILTAKQIGEIEQVLKQADQAVKDKKKAADFLATMVKVADISLTVISKASAAV